MDREDLVVTPKTIVIWGIEEYRQVANNQLNNTEFYQPRLTDYFEDYQRITINSVVKLHSDDLINEETVDRLIPINAKPAYFLLTSQNT